MMSREQLQGGAKRLSVETAKGLSCAAYAAMLFAPSAINHTIENTHVDTRVTDIPTELGFYPGASQLDILNQANIRSDDTVVGIGISAKITGLPRVNSIKDAEDLLSTQRLNVYASMADSPNDAVMPYIHQLRQEATKNATDYVLPRTILGGAALYGALALYRSRRRIKELEGSPSKPGLARTSVAGLAVMGVASSLTVGDMNFQNWTQSTPDQPGAMTISALDGTPLQGATIDNPSLLEALNTGIGYAGILKDRRVEHRKEYLDEVLPELERQISQLADLRESEQLYLLASDTHASKAGTEIIYSVITSLRQRFGDDSLRNMTYLGDLTQGADFQRDSIHEQAAVLKDGTTTVVAGNHEGSTVRFIEETEMVLVDGIVEAQEGITMYGRPDPQTTPFLGSSFYANPEFTQTELGERTYEDTLNNPVTAINLHQPAAVASLLDIDDFREYLETPSSSLTECSEPSTDIRAVNAAIISAGHWHEQFQLKVICNPDGTWTTVNIQGTAGGANEAPTINSWSDPDGSPQKNVSLRIAIHNTEYNSITGMIDIVITPDGEVASIERIDIGTEDGAPFTYDTESESAVSERTAKKK